MDDLVIVLKRGYICNTLDVFKTRKVCRKIRESVLSFPLFDHLRFLCLEDRYRLVII